MNNRIWVVALVLVAILIGGYLVTGNQPEVSAQGDASLDVKPDKVSVYVSIESKNLTLKEAQAENSRVRESVVSALKSLGFEEEDLKFINYNSYPWVDWSDGKSKDKGFIVYQQIVIESEDFVKVPRIVDAVVGSGALVQSIQFELSDKKQEEYKIEALKKASENAKEKARAIAAGQGRSIGKLVSLQNQEYGYYPMPYFEAKSFAAADNAVEARTAVSNLSPQDLQVTASISAKYKLAFF